MLKYNELEERDRRRRFKMIMELPAFIIGFSLSLFEFNYILIMTMVTGILVIELIIFGLMDVKYNYSLSDFVKDMMFLFTLNFLVTLLATPGFLYTLNQATSATYTFTNVIRLTVSFTLLYASWYVYIIMMIRLKKKPDLKWKWDVTGIIASDKKRFAVK
ncbi:MAG: hypothetical protein JJU16_07565 [Alkalibacterium sp.]|nr:hypothetical protein [Alkalibacterium sp.]